ncbi:helix-turn-helix transcriptional regulator [Streptomyces sp. E11-3]|uniref:helix-turn-helix domain-containing protein n=1 Tax=Streptomyces sp. E11-3 TaxID=3110112 RepID=UPI003980091A
MRGLTHPRGGTQRGPAGSWERVLALPHPRLRPGVIAYRGFRLALDQPRRRLETPIGAVTLLLGFGHHPLRVHHATRPTVTRTSALSGLTTTPVLGEHDGRLSGIEVLLAPWAAFTLFGVAQHELAEQVADPDEVLPYGPLAPSGTSSDAPSVRNADRGRHRHRHRYRYRYRRISDLSDALSALPSWHTRFTLLDEILIRWSDAGTPCSTRTAHAWSELVRTRGTLPVHQLAEEVGWSVRQLESRFREQIGLSPKAAARVLRLQHARRLLATGHSQAETAAVCGFYDQSHLSGEFRAMTGCTPGEFTAARRSAAPGYGPPGPDRLAGEATSLLLPPGADATAPFSKTGGHS